MYGNVHTLPIERFEQGALGPPVPPSLWLAAEEDILPPLQAIRSGTGYQIASGTEIWRAAQLANLYQVPALLLDQMPAATPKATQSAYLKDPITEATALEILKETHHLTDAALAERLDWTRKKVADYRRLLNLEPVVQEQVRAGRLSVTKAAELVSIPPNRQRQLAERAVNLKLSLADIRGLARRWKTQRKAEAESSHEDQPSQGTSATTDYSTDPDIARLERNIEDAIGCRVRIDNRNNQLVINYSDLDVLDGLIERLVPNG